MARPRKLPAGMWKRANTYYARFRSGGRLVRKRLSTDFDAACDILTELRARASRGEFSLIDNDYPWADLKAEFLKWARQAVRNPGEYERDLSYFEKYCAVKSIKQVDQQYVLGYREWRLGQAKWSITGKETKKGTSVSPRTVNREVGTLRCMLNKGVDWGRIASNAIERMKPLRNDRPRKDRRPLTVEEVNALFTHAPEYLKPVWRLFMTTGIRRDELVGLRFDDIDFERKAIVIQAHRAKNGKAREIPLDDEMGATLKALRLAAGDREHVFVTTTGTAHKNNLLRAFYANCKRAGIEGAHHGGSVDIHSLRVTFTTLALEHGANPKAIQAILGHSTLALTMSVYAKATEKSKREAIAALPFAAVSSPSHIVSMHGAHKMSTPSNPEAQPVSGKPVAG